MSFDLLKDVFPLDSLREPSFAPIICDRLGDCGRFGPGEKVVGPFGPSQNDRSGWSGCTRYSYFGKVELNERSLD